MKRISLKMKLTLLYTLLMSGVVVILLALLFSLSSRQILSSVQARLRQQVYDAAGDVEFEDGTLDFDSDFDDMEGGVFLSAYASDGTWLYGRVPSGFNNTLAFADGSLRERNDNGRAFYVMDLYIPIDGYGNIYIRGIASGTEAEQDIYIIRSAALILLPLMVLLTAVLSYFMTRHTLKPVSRITRTVQQIRRENDLSKRIRLGEGKDEIYQMAQTFDAMLDQVEAGMKREQQFTSDVSHELRTPIASMMLQCEELLDAPDLDEKTRSGVAFLDQKVRYLARMIAQLLLLSRADQGRQTLQWETVDFSEMADMVALEAQDMAQEKQIRVHADIQPGIYVTGDETLLIRVWMNLLENAVRYGKEKGQIHLRLFSEGGLAIGSVKDDGIGIAKDDLPRIWERFYQADAARSQSDSSGLGLSMVRWIVNAHNGSIRVESTPGKGSCFTFKIPLKPQ